MTQQRTPRRLPSRAALLAAALCAALLAWAPGGRAQEAAASAPAATGTLRYDLRDEIFHPVHALHGMVASENALASEVGVKVLQEGGNAVDAAVATAFTLAVTLPNAGNIGGGGFMLLHDAKSGRETAIDFRETAPAAATRDMFLDAAGNVIPNKSLFTHAAVGVPGTVAGMMYALEHYGTKKRAALLAPAIALADKGFPVGEELALTLQAEQKHLGAFEPARQIFFKDGRPLREGEILRNHDLAWSLRMISRDGAKAFYEGSIGAAIVAESRAHGGLLTSADLRNYRVIERMPVRGSYRGYEIVSMPPPSSGGVHIVQMLNVLSNFPLKDWGHNSAKAIHVMAETMKLAYADRSQFLGDPDFVKIPVKGLTSTAYANELAKKIDLEHATPSAGIRPGNPMQFEGAAASDKRPQSPASAASAIKEGNETTHFTVADSAGNVVSVTYTLNTNFGTGIVANGTGILLNNEMDDFSAKPGVPNAYGLVGGDANAVQAGKRPLSSMSPTIVLKDGKPWLATGSPGGSRIITTVLQTLINMIDFGMNSAEAASTERIHHQWLPDELRVEKGLNADTIALLTTMGHKVVERAAMGRTQTIQILPTGLYGFSDPRNPSGATIGY